MAQFVNRNDISAEIDVAHLTKFLDDNGDGVEDSGLFNALADSVDQEILGSVASVPADSLASLASWLRYAGRILFCEMAYRRKGVDKDSNPYADIGETIRTRLGDIQTGKLSLQGSKGFSFLVPARSSNPFASNSDRIESSASTGSTVDASSGTLVLTATDGKRYEMTVSYSGGQVVHSWQEVV